MFIHPLIPVMFGIGELEWWLCTHGWQTEIERESALRLSRLTKLTQVQSKRWQLLTCHFISAIKSENAHQTHTHTHTRILTKTHKNTHQERPASALDSSPNQTHPNWTVSAPAIEAAHNGTTSVSVNTHILTLIFTLFVCLLAF